MKFHTLIIFPADTPNYEYPGYDSKLNLIVKFHTLIIFPADTPNYEYPGYDSKLNLIVKFHILKSEKSRVHPRVHYSQVQPDPEWLYLLLSHLGVK